METLLAEPITMLMSLLAAFLLGMGIYAVLAGLRGRQTRAAYLRETAQRQRQRAQTIYRMVSSLSSTLNYQKVLETALDMSASALSVPEDRNDRLVSAALLYEADENDPGEMRLRVASARRFTPADLRIELDGAQGLTGRTIDQGEAQHGEDLAFDPELSRIVALRICKSAYSIPLRTGLDTYGVLLFAHPDPAYFQPDRCELLDMIASQSMIALQNARLYQDLEQEKERMIEIQEETRRKLARDLHDGPTQSVAAIAMRVNFARRLIERDAEKASSELLKIEDLARRTSKEIRHMLFTLRPLALESKGLSAALQQMAEKMHETYNQKVIVQVDENAVQKLEMGKQAVIFYIVEEAVTNARKHAQAESIWVHLQLMQPDVALLAIEDNGVGFNIASIEGNYDNRGSLGLVNMRERAELINGVFHVQSTPGKGTKVQIALPLSEEAAERIRNRRL